MKKIHHANLVNVKGDSRSFIFPILEKDLNFKIQGNPDFLLLENESFGIDDARYLENWVIGKPLIGDIKISVIIAKSITREAQNALLKVLEEPPLGTYIFMSFQDVGNLLPTLLSRIRILGLRDMDKNENVLENNLLQKEATKFNFPGIKEKLSIIRSLSKKEDKGVMKDLIKNLEEISYKEYSQNKRPDAGSVDKMKKILTAKIFAASRGSSPKILLEWLSCVL